jgi:hypothetical protein
MHHRSKGVRVAWAVLAACAALWLSGSPVLAQSTRTSPIDLKPPTPPKADKPPAIMNMLILVVIAALIIGATFMPTRRGHQD